ncbi:MAG: Ig-like domain-containing protein [Lachnospiraceae bacterium]|nr:Ig-like domain-containing protein [Lachnospiraceae bacterium]
MNTARFRKFISIITALAIVITLTATGGSGDTVKVYAAPGSQNVYVPLEFRDLNYNSVAQIEENNKFGYGLCYAKPGDAGMTLQLFTPDSTEHPDCWHYLLMLENVEYKYTEEAKTRMVVDRIVSTISEANAKEVRSDIAPDDLVPFEQEDVSFRWFSSNPSVALVDMNSGMITAVSAGFARITCTSKVANPQYEIEEVSFDVVVVPEAKVFDTEDGMSERFIYRADPGQKDIVLQTNVSKYSDLKWMMFRGDTVSDKNEITKDYSDKIEISDATGRVVLKDLTAGVYTIVAMPHKSEEALKTATDYSDVNLNGFQNVNIQYFAGTIIVPFDFTEDTLTMEYYDEEIFDSYDILEKTNSPKGLFTFKSENKDVATVDPNTGLIEARGIGSTRVIATPVKEQDFETVFGSYYATAHVVSGSSILVDGVVVGTVEEYEKAAAASGAAIGYSGGKKIFTINVVSAMSLNLSSLTMTAGTYQQLYLTAPSPYDDTVWWTSLNSQVAKVDSDGIIEAVGIGTARIVAQIEIKGKKKRAICKVTVTEAKAEANLVFDSDTVLTGDTINAELRGDSVALKGKYTWSGSDEQAVSIESKKYLKASITGLIAGNVVITARDDRMGIVVSKPIRVIQKLDKIFLSESEVRILLSEGSYKLYAGSMPSFAGDSPVTWETTDDGIASVDSEGNVTLKKVGQAVITVISEDGHEARCTFIIGENEEDLIPTPTPSQGTDDSGEGSGSNTPGGGSGTPAPSQGEGGSSGTSGGGSGTSGGGSGTPAPSQGEGGGSGTSGGGSGTPTPSQGTGGGSGTSGGGSGIIYPGGGESYTGGGSSTGDGSSYYPYSGTTPTPVPSGKTTPTPTPQAEKDKKVPEKTVTTDKYGNVTTYEVTQKKDGSVSTIKTIENVDGTFNRVELIEYNDGTSMLRTTNKEADGSKKVYTSYTNKDGKVIQNVVEVVEIEDNGDTVERVESTSDDGSYSLGITVTSKDGKERRELVENRIDGTVRITLTNTNPNGEITKRVYVTDRKGNTKLTKYETDRRLASVASNLMLSDNSKYSIYAISKNTFKENKVITRATIGNTVTTIGTEAFKNAKNLKTIVIYSNKIKKVGRGAFSGINKKAVIQIVGSEKTFNAIKKKITDSGIAKTVTFERVKPNQ